MLRRRQYLHLIAQPILDEEEAGRNGEGKGKEGRRRGAVRTSKEVQVGSEWRSERHGKRDR